MPIKVERHRGASANRRKREQAQARTGASANRRKREEAQARKIPRETPRVNPNGN